MVPPNLPIRPELEGVSPYGAPQLDVAHRLNVNENPYPPSPQMVSDITRAVERAARGLNRYADRDCRDLRAGLADYLAAESGVQLAVDQVWAANGSNEVMIEILQAFGGHSRTVLTPVPSYSMYPEYARDTGTRFLGVARRPDFGLDWPALEKAFATHRPAVTFVASPNNPTGTALAPDEAQALVELARDHGPEGAWGIVVIDEAYGEFRRSGTPSALHLIADHPNVVVTRTMSKAFGMAGLRLGYLAAQPAIIDALMVVRLPYHLSGLTQAAALAALSHASAQLAQVDQLRRRRDELQDFLRALGLTCPDSDANFCLFGPFADRRSVFEALLRRGVLIREVGPEGFLRVSVGTAEDDRAFRRALKEVLS